MMRTAPGSHRRSSENPDDLYRYDQQRSMNPYELHRRIAGALIPVLSLGNELRDTPTLWFRHHLVTFAAPATGAASGD
jgi:hypothetical protein